jgi:ribose transport system substrate-binding protein
MKTFAKTLAVLSVFVLAFSLAIPAMAGDKVVIGYSISTLNNAFFVGMTRGVENGAKKLGVELITVNANGDSAKQAADVEDLITKKVSAIIINPRDAEAIAPSVKKALQRTFPYWRWTGG